MAGLLPTFKTFWDPIPTMRFPMCCFLQAFSPSLLHSCQSPAFFPGRTLFSTTCVDYFSEAKKFLSLPIPKSVILLILPLTLQF